jgi:hypothetical protein
MHARACSSDVITPWFPLEYSDLKKVGHEKQSGKKDETPPMGKSLTTFHHRQRTEWIVLKTSGRPDPVGERYSHALAPSPVPCSNSTVQKVGAAPHQNTRGARTRAGELATQAEGGRERATKRDGPHLKKQHVQHGQHFDAGVPGTTHYSLAPRCPRLRAGHRQSQPHDHQILSQPSDGIRGNKRNQGQRFGQPRDWHLGHGVGLHMGRGLPTWR